MGGHHRANFLYRPKDAPGNFTSFDTNVVAEGDRGKMVSNEKLTKNLKITGVKISWVDNKSNKYPYFHTRDSRIQNSVGKE